MKILFALGALCLLLGGCPRPPKPAQSPKFNAPAAFKLPEKIAEASYKGNREIYDALPVNAIDRDAYRKQLLKYLLLRAEKASAPNGKQDEKQMVKAFAEALTLYDPSEIHGTTITEEDLDALAAKMVRTFSARGDEMRVLLALAARISLHPKDDSLKQKFDQILKWVDRSQRLTHGAGFAGMKTIQILESVAQLWPSPFVNASLSKFYASRTKALAQLTRRDPRMRALRGAFPSLLQLGYRVARLYIRVDRPYEALSRLRKMKLGSAQDQTLLGLLESSVSPSATVEDQIRLAEHFERRDLDVALRICRAATRRFPDDAPGHACVGRLAGRKQLLYMAVRAEEEAVRLNPNSLPYTTALARQYLRRLFETIGRDHLVDAQAQLGKIEVYYAKAKKRFRKALEPSLGRAHFAIGHGYYNAGMIKKAIAAFRKSLSGVPSQDAYLQLAKIHFKRGQMKEALAEIDGAERVQIAQRQSPKRRKSAREAIYWKGRIWSLRGHVLGLGSDKAAAVQAHRKAILAWQELTRTGVDPSTQAEIHIRVGRSLYALGLRAEALNHFDRAIDAKPSRKETYAEIIAMLTTYGHLPEALDAFHRALGRQEVSEYLKSYCSFWVLGLARRAGVKADPLALAYLKRHGSKRWYGQLSGPVLGSRTFESLAKVTTDPGHLAELYYYWSDALVAKGNKAEAQKLWQRVVDSQRMAFFEYDMASHNLRHGPSKVQREPVDRR
jgi:tetratricopeptide (TPR) repeat protein